MLFIFDMGGVVTNTFEMDMMMDKIGISKDLFWDICKKGKRNIWDEFQKGLIGAVEFWKLFNEESRQYNVKPVNHDLFRLCFHLSKKPLTIELIKGLKKNNRVVCGTNTIESHYDNHMERGDYAFFHQTYASNKIQAVKPDPLFFNLIMEAEGYKPEETFFVDDKIENCKASESLGINTVHFSTEEDLYNKWKKYF